MMDDSRRTYDRQRDTFEEYKVSICWFKSFIVKARGHNQGPIVLVRKRSLSWGSYLWIWKKLHTAKMLSWCLTSDNAFLSSRLGSNFPPAQQLQQAQILCPWLFPSLSHFATLDTDVRYLWYSVDLWFGFSYRIYYCVIWNMFFKVRYLYYFAYGKSPLRTILIEILHWCMTRLTLLQISVLQSVTILHLLVFSCCLLSPIAIYFCTPITSPAPCNKCSLAYRIPNVQPSVSAYADV